MIPRLKTHYSLLTSTIRIEDLVTAKKMGYETIALTDTHTISGAVAFHNECKKRGIKGLLGVELAVRNSDESVYTLTLICRNHDAWLKLLKIIAIANNDDNFKNKPSIDIDAIRGIVKREEFICIDGYVGSLLYERIFESPKGALIEGDYDGAAKHLKIHWKENAAVHISNMKHLFGDGYVVEINRLENENFPVGLLTSNCVQEVSSGICSVVGGSTAHYIDHPEDQKLLLCIKMKCSLDDFDEKIKHADYCWHLKFSRNNSFRLREHTELIKAYEDLNVIDVGELCEPFEILSKPQLPHFQCDGTEIDYLRQLCRNGWRNKLLPSGKVASPEIKEVYRLRIEEELKVIEEAGIAGYFLIVQDIMRTFRKDYLLGPGRGSSSGCLVSYLTDITGVDPIEYGLLFERFYNNSRGKLGQLPDIDMDFPPSIREQVLTYIREKYGHDKVCQMITLGRLQGRSIIQEVLRVNGTATPSEIFTITKRLPKEDKISDKLAEMETPSVIRWVLEHDPKLLSDYVYLEDGKVCGARAAEFEQALRLEGIFKATGIHAAGVIISARPLSELVPLVRAKGPELVGGMEMGDLEALGAVKIDVLGVAILEKIMKVVFTG